MTLNELLVKQGFKKGKKRVLTESILDPVHKTLSKEVWEGEKIKSSHRDFILDKLTNWLEEMEITEKPAKVYILGSITGFQYNKLADIDVNVFMKNISDDQYDKLVSMLPNGEDLPGTKHPVNFYISKTDDTIKKSDGSYDLLNNVWDNKADKKDVKVPYTYVLEIAKFFMSGIDERFAEYNRDKTDYELYKSLLQDENIESDKKEIEKIIETKEQEIKSDLDALYVAKHMVRSFRVEAFEKDDDEENEFLIDIKIPNADYSVNNMVYKIIERYGYLDRLVEVLKERDNYKD